MLIFAAEGMLKGKLEALLSLHDTILLDGNANPAPVLLLLAQPGEHPGSFTRGERLEEGFQSGRIT